MQNTLIRYDGNHILEQKYSYSIQDDRFQFDDESKTCRNHLSIKQIFDEKILEISEANQQLDDLTQNPLHEIINVFSENSTKEIIKKFKFSNVILKQLDSDSIRSKQFLLFNYLYRHKKDIFNALLDTTSKYTLFTQINNDQFYLLTFGFSKLISQKKDKEVEELLQSYPLFNSYMKNNYIENNKILNIKIKYVELLYDNFILILLFRSRYISNKIKFINPVNFNYSSEKSSKDYILDNLFVIQYKLNFMLNQKVVCFRSTEYFNNEKSKFISMDCNTNDMLADSITDIFKAIRDTVHDAPRNQNNRFYSYSESLCIPLFKYYKKDKHLVIQNINKNSITINMKIQLMDGTFKYIDNLSISFSNFISLTKFQEQLSKYVNEDDIKLISKFEIGCTLDIYSKRPYEDNTIRSSINAYLDNTFSETINSWYKSTVLDKEIITSNGVKDSISTNNSEFIIYLKFLYLLKLNKNADHHIFFTLKNMVTNKFPGTNETDFYQRIESYLNKNRDKEFESYAKYFNQKAKIKNLTKAKEMIKELSVLKQLRLISSKEELIEMKKIGNTEFG